MARRSGSVFERINKITLRPARLVLQVGIPSRCVTTQVASLRGQLSAFNCIPPGSLNRLGLPTLLGQRREYHLCRVAGNTV